MNTRFFDDECRVAKKLQQETGAGRYYLEVPGNGARPCFILDPHVVPQKWGGNLWTNCTDLQSSMMGLDRRLDRDCGTRDVANPGAAASRPISYPVCTQEITEDPRAVNPAWNLRGEEVSRPGFVWGNRQARTERPDAFNSRAWVKDEFARECQQHPR
jgi:hypothetical protein